MGKQTQAQRQADWNAMTPAQQRAANQAQRSGTTPAGGGGAKPPTAPPPATSDQMFHETYGASQNRVDNANYQAGSQYIQNNLDNTNFDGQNDYYSQLAGQVGDANFNEPLNLLRNFIGGTGSGQQQAYRGPGAGYGHGGSVVFDPATGKSTIVNQSATSGSAGGDVPDTVGGKNTFFAQHMRDLFDPSRLDPANDPTMQPYLDALTQQSNKAFAQNKALLDAQAEGSGRFGGGMYQNMQGLAAGQNAQALQAQLAQTLFGARQNALSAQMEGLGLTNQRDLGAMQDATQRYGIDAQRDAAAAASGAGYAANQAAIDQQNKAMQLQAIGMLQGQQQFGLSALGDLGHAWQTGQQGSLNSIPGLEGANQGYLQGMLGAGQGVSGNEQSVRNAASAIRQAQIGAAPGMLSARNQIPLAQMNNAAQIRAAQIGAGPAMAGLRFQQQQWNDPLSQIGRFVDVLGGIGGMGGGQWGQGQAPAFIPNGASPGGAALGGLIGGYLQGGQQGGGR